MDSSGFCLQDSPGQEGLWPFLSADDRLFLSSGLSSFYSELMKGLGAGGRLWELLERRPQLPFNGGYAAGRFVVFTVRLAFCPPQGIGHCQALAPLKQGGQGSHGTRMGTLHGMLWK